MGGRLRFCGCGNCAVHRAIAFERFRKVGLLVAQGFYRIEPGGEISRDQCRERTNEESADTNDPNILSYDLRWDFRELINFTRKNLDVQSRSQPMAELVAVTDQRHPKAEPGNGAKKANDCS